MAVSHRQAWTCPICNKFTPMETLRVDSWLKQIIAESPPETIEVELLSDGTWKPKVIEDQKDRQEESQTRKRPRKTGPASDAGLDGPHQNVRSTLTLVLSAVC